MKESLSRPSLSSFVSPTTVVFWLLIISVAMFDIGVGVISLLSAVVIIFYALYPTLNIEQKNIHKYNLTRLDVHLFPVAKRIVELIEKAHVGKNITIFVSERTDLDSPFAFGTFRKGFLVIPAWLLIDYDVHADDYDTVLLHEIAHIKFGDSWKKELSQSLALVFLGLLVVLLFLTFLQVYWFRSDPTGWDIFNGFSKIFRLPENLYPSEYQSGNQMAGVWFGKYASLQFSALYYWEFALLGLAGFVVYSSLRILAQSRELYADAFAAQIKNVNSVKHAFSTMALISMERRNNDNSKKRSWKITKILSLFGERWLSFHPPALERKGSLDDIKYILNYHMQAILLGGVIAEIANWHTLLQSKAWISDSRSLGFVLPFLLGIWLLFVTNDFFLVNSIESSKHIFFSVLRNTMIFSFGVCFVHITLITAYALGFEMYGVLYGDLYANNTLLFWLLYVIPSIAIYLFVFPFILFLNSLIIVAIKRHYLRIGSDPVSFHRKTSLINLLLMFALWNGVFGPILAILGFGSLGLGSVIWFAVLFLIAIWAATLQKKRIEMQCPNCKSNIVLLAKQYRCPNCGQMISQWAFVHLDAADKSA